MSSLNLVSETKTPAPTGDLLREANHRISNHLALLTAMVRSQISGIDKGPEILSRTAAKEMLVATTGKLVSVSRLHHRLSEQSHLQSIFLSDYVVDLCKSLVSSLALSQRVYFVHHWRADCRLLPEQAQYLGLLINEIMINALKHAHPTGLPVQLAIRCERQVSLVDGAVAEDEITGDDDGWTRSRVDRIG